MELWECEHTDTFSGEANYAWVDRASVEAREGLEERALGRLFKAALGLTGVRGRTYWHGDDWEFRPYRSATVAFARFVS